MTHFSGDFPDIILCASDLQKLSSILQRAQEGTHRMKPVLDNTVLHSCVSFKVRHYYIAF